MLEINLSLEAHDWKHDLHYMVRIATPLDVFVHYPERILYDIDRARHEIIELYKKQMIENKFHLQVVK